ncbi:hypothetical protein [Vibrio harveyi]|jgi:hypothetical protein|uniref:hypothetical protein n=1 Tax=Vibrio harveyi TaxID=669 RepID=UPI00028D4810|nr:hypothetical protein [Vibrio harveyi]EKM18263.1 hypothetical protein VCHENC01_5103 [Vibrio harveyi]EKO3816368.1 hypothetical protein [Vibrio harveyi]EKO3818457.1 hypothetical protein [Vibrio harveyi]EKO3818470.1 hypothetical protein [Vibrio harveyi]EKO3818483.1 hypothetical protein [Vibrio harveyi]
MKKQRLIGLLAAVAFSANAGLELTNTYQDWEHYESKSFDTGEAVILGVSSVKSDANVDTVALRCTTEGVNLLFFNGLLREELGYAAKASLDNGQVFTMDVWIKGKTHWATVPVEQLNDFYQANSLKVELKGDAPKVEKVDVSLRGFKTMYQTLIPSCK